MSPLKKEKLKIWQHFNDRGNEVIGYVPVSVHDTVSDEYGFVLDALEDENVTAKQFHGLCVALWNKIKQYIERAA